MKKGCMIAVGVAVAGVAALAGTIFLVFGLTAGAASEADRFLGLLGDGKTHDAYLATSETFQVAQSEESFATTVQQLGLQDFVSASWNSRAIENNLATLEGTVKTRQGGTNHLTVELIKEKGGWKILSLRGPAAGATAESGGMSVPPDAQLNRLADQSLRDMNVALKTKDFQAFYGTISQLWQRQIDANKLLEVFQPLIDRQVDLSEIKGVEPVFDQVPEINDQSLLVLSGYYPGKAERTVFQLKYTYEHPDWKLFGIQVAVVPDVQNIPDEETLRDLAKESLLEFNAAVQNKDFTDFYGKTSQTWQGQTSAEQLAEIFKSFVDKEIDISSIQDVAPDFSEPATIDNDGVLSIRGVYPTEPVRVVFDLSYVYEQSTWKLLGVSLSLRE